jgi:hypothetical protein
MNKNNLTRGDVIVAVSNSFSVNKEQVKQSLDRLFPRLFFPLITMAEYREFLVKFKSENP